MSKRARRIEETRERVLSPNYSRKPRSVYAKTMACSVFIFPWKVYSAPGIRDRAYLRLRPRRTKQSMSHLRDTHNNIFPLRAMLLAFLTIFATSCSSDRDNPDQAMDETQAAEPMPPAPVPEAADAIASLSADTMYSDAPKCNALVKRIADEVVPCLQRINPEYSERLQTTIETFRKSPRMLLDPVHRDEVLRRTEEDCQAYWRSIVSQLDSKSPEAQCRLDVAN